MRSLNAVLLAASLTMISILPAAAQTVITATGEMKKATMKGTKMPAGAKEIDAKMAVVVMNGKRYLVPLSREFNEMFTY